MRGGDEHFGWRYAGRVDAYDIDNGSVDAARARARILGQENITFHVEPAAGLLARVRRDHPEGTADVVVLFAVLEHQHPLERLETLSACWGMLREGGLLVVVETPNRLAYFDPHTSLLPFFSMLPPEIAVRYAEKVAAADVCEGDRGGEEGVGGGGAGGFGAVGVRGELPRV